MRPSRTLLYAAISAVALTAAGSASAVTCSPEGGSSTPFNPIDPASVTQNIINTLQTGGGAFSCEVSVQVNNGAPMVYIAGNITDVTQSVVAGDQLTVDVFQGGTQLLNDFVIGLFQTTTNLTGPVLAGIPLRIVSAGFFENLGERLAAISQQFTISTMPPNAVPLPAAAPMLASALGLGGFIGWRRKRKQRQALAAA